MVRQLPSLITVKRRLGALTGLALLTTVFAEDQVFSAPLSGASRQIEPDHVNSEIVRIKSVKYRGQSTVDRRGYRYYHFRYAGDFPQYRYTVFEEGYASGDYFPPEPHYYSHRYNWYPPLTTFRNVDPLWYAW